MASNILQAIFVCITAIGIVYVTQPYCVDLVNLAKNILTDRQDEMEKTIYSAWEDIISNREKAGFHSIAIGTNSDVDMILSGTKLLRKLGTTDKAEENISPVDHQTIVSLQQLQQVFAFFHSKGAGGERFMGNKALYKKAVDAAKEQEDTQFFVGGNGALMAEVIARKGKDVKVLFGGTVGPKLRSLMNPSINVPTSVLVEEDEYHVIMEYGRNEKWAGVEAPIASRFIFSHDITNAKMLVFEKFIQSLQTFQADLVILSGFHMLEGQGKQFWKQRISEIAKLIANIPREIPVHLELASMADPEFMKEMSEEIFELVHSIGLNEQELWLVCQANHGPHCMEKNAAAISLDSPPNPGTTGDILYWMMSRFSIETKPASHLSRIHFHTLPYHVVTTLENSQWRNGPASVSAGARITSTQSCGDPTIQPGKVEMRLGQTFALTNGGLPSELKNKPSASVRFDPKKPVTNWTAGKINFHLTPVLVCKKPVKTVGLGDAISAMGLLFSGYQE